MTKRFTVVTILPELIEPALTAGVVGRAKEAGTIAVATVNPRDFTTDKHRTVDDTPYGGGPGMVMKAEPLLAAIAAAGSGETSTTSVDKSESSTEVVQVSPAPTPRRILMSPSGTPLTQQRVRELAAYDHLVLVCGRYEGIDQRVIDHAIDEELSIGDYVLSGGELAALVVIDAVARLVPGVLGEPTSADDESFSAGTLEYPQYTRPPVLPAATIGAAEDAPIPAVLSSGNHAAIAAWRRAQSLARTATRRPDLFRRVKLTKADRKLYGSLRARTHIALVHHPIVDRTGAIVTSAVTNFDIHDIARSSMTYGLASYSIVTPITSQREKAAHIAQAWIGDEQGEHRAAALRLVRTAASVEDVIAAITEDEGRAPVVTATSARPTSFPAAARRTSEELVAEMTLEPAPLLLLLGTGWGLADELIPSVSRVLAPIEGDSEWNHLSVRSAAAIILDRLFGRPA
jgi:tRNA (guanine37-N1)-methyltransferase